MSIDVLANPGISSVPGVPSRKGATSVALSPGDALAHEIGKQLSLLPAEAAYHLTGVSWEAYQQLVVDRDTNRRRSKITFNRGALSVTTTSSIRERWKKTLAMMIESCAMDTNISFESTGNLPITREALGRGLEPDETYYFQNADRVPRHRPLDFSIDPLPDLAIEIEYSKSAAADRLPVFAELGFPELWLFDGEHLRILLLNNGAYSPSRVSKSLPTIPIDLIGELLPRVSEMAGSMVVREFRSRLPKS